MKTSRARFCLFLKLVLCLRILNIQAQSLKENQYYAAGALKPTEMEQRSEKLTLKYSDDQIEFYFDPNLESDKSFTFPFKTVSDGWQYAKATYGLFKSTHPNQTVLRLQINLCKKYSDKEFECNSDLMEFSHNLKPSQNIFTIDCVTANWAETADKLDHITRHLGWIVLTVKMKLDSWPFLSLSQLEMPDIIAHDIYTHIRVNHSAADWGQRNTYTRGHLFLLRDWYRPIYDQNGGELVLLRYFTHVFSYWPRNATNYIGQMNLGELVHFWSGTVEQDLKIQAIQAFGWTSEDDVSLAGARLEYPQFNYTHTQEIVFVPPRRWNEKWFARTGSLHTKHLFLIKTIRKVAFYFDSNIVGSVNLTYFNVIADAWEYTTRTYGPLGPDPFLYVVLHSRDPFHLDLYKLDCTVSKRVSYFDPNFTFRNVIDCPSFTQSYNYYNWTEEEHNFLVNKLIEEMGSLILRGYSETGNWPAQSVSQWTAKYIFAYDIFLGVGRSLEGGQWLQDKLNSTTTMVPRPITFWLRDWYHPIYESYGGSHILKRFLSLVHLYWPQKDNNYDKQMTLAEFVHFWSGAVGGDLWNLAAKSFGWNTRYHKHYFNAKIDYPHLNYSATFPNTTIRTPPETWTENWKLGYTTHNEELHLSYVDAHIAIYYDSNVRSTATWFFEPLSDGWRYVKETYGPFGFGFRPDPVLYVALHQQAEYSLTVEGPPRRGKHFSNQFENRTVIDCCEVYVDWNSARFLDLLTEQLGETVLRGAKQTGNWPTYDIAGYKLASILRLDIYMGIGRTKEAVRNLKAVFPKTLTDDWYCPIYLKYGRSLVLNDFLSLLHTHWPKDAHGQDYANQLNAGEFVHFWSGAAGVNLKHLFKKALGLRLSVDFDQQLKEAIGTFSTITYTEVPDDSAANTSLPLLLTEEWIGHEELLYQVYADAHLSIYVDFYFPYPVNWPIGFLSQALHHCKKSYDFLNRPSPSFLQANLHGKLNSRCQFMWNNSGDFPRSHSSNANHLLIDCGGENRNWKIDSPENTEDLLKQFGSLLQQATTSTSTSQTIQYHRANNKGKAYYSRPLTEIIVFDLYLQMGRIEDAHRKLKNIITNEKKAESSLAMFRFRDWYLPIYNSYGGVSVLNEFLLLLRKHQSIIRNGSNSNSNSNDVDSARLNVGELLHLWSGAADFNLIDLAKSSAFRWNQEHQRQFENARTQLPFNYSCYKNCGAGVEVEETENELIFNLFITLGVFFFVVLAACFIYILYSRRKMRQMEDKIRELTPLEISDFFEGSVKSNMESQDTENSVHTCVESKPFNKTYEIRKEQLDVYYDRVLGSGNFGLVLRGSLRGLIEEEEVTEITTVAVKTVKAHVDTAVFKALLSELKVMAYLGKHDNIVSLLGAVTQDIKNRELCIALEFCAKGDLLKFLKNHRKNFKNVFTDVKVATIGKENSGCLESTEAPKKINSPSLYLSSSNSTNAENPQNALSTLDLIEWSQQISNGMMFISSKNVIHGDLAARNVLITGDNVAKISDFGLSRQLLNYTFYTKKSQTPIPWRWMAIEFLRDRKFSVESDVWSFGVTLYEIFSLGSIPYAGCDWSPAIVEKLLRGYRVSSPEYGTQDIYDLMLNCMKMEPTERLQWGAIIEALEKIKEKVRELVGTDENKYCIYEPLDFE